MQIPDHLLNEHYDDRYFDVVNAIDEADRIHFQGNRILERLAAQEAGKPFVIGETGFGASRSLTEMSAWCCRSVLCRLGIGLLLSMLVAGSCTRHPAQPEVIPEPELAKEFLQNHATTLAVTQQQQECAISPQQLDEAIVFLSGESHAVANNYAVQLTLLSYFAEKASVRYLLMEAGYASGQLLQRYLQTGDTTHLDLVFSRLKGTLSYSREARDFVIKVRELNQTRMRREPIRIVGIDIEHQMITAYQYLRLLLPQTPPPGVIAPYVSKVANPDSLPTSYALLRDFSRTLLNSCTANAAVYTAFLDSNSTDFLFIVKNINVAYDYYDAKGDKNLRERSLCANFTSLYERLPKKKYYGQFGMAHVYQKQCSSDMPNVQRFAMFLKDAASPVEGKVVSIASMYKECQYMNASTLEPVSFSTDFSSAFTLLFDSQNPLTIYSLGGTDSPFERNLYFVQGGSGGVTTDYFQYLIRYVRSPAVRPYQHTVIAPSEDGMDAGVYSNINLKVD